MGPAAVVLEFVRGQPPPLHPLADLPGHARIVGDEVEPALLVVLVLFEYLAAPLVARLGIIVVLADVVRAHRPVVVRVRLAVRDRVELVEGLAPARFKDPHQQFVLPGIVARRAGKRDAIVRMIAQAHAVTIRLDSSVAPAVLARRRTADARQHPAPRVARHDVGTDRPAEHAEMMPVMQDAGLHSVPLFVVDAARFSPDVVRNPRRRHQIAFVGRIDEHPACKRPATERGDRGDARPLLRDPSRAIEPLAAVHGNLMLAHKILENALGHMRFENPHRALSAVDGRSALSFVPIRLLLLPDPGIRFVVVPPHTMIKLAGEPADNRFVARVREAKTAAGKAAQMPLRTHDDNGLAHPPGLHRGHDPSRSAAIDDKVRPGAHGPNLAKHAAEKDQPHCGSPDTASGRAHAFTS